MVMKYQKQITLQLENTYKCDYMNLFIFIIVVLSFPNIRSNINKYIDIYFT